MAIGKKIKSFAELVNAVDGVRAQGKTVVLCHGVFDVLHIGHIRYLQKAKTLGDVLAVTITPNDFVNKGPHRPAFDEKLRSDAIAALECTDYVAVNEWPTAVETIRRLRPDIYAKGAEFRDSKTPELLEEEASAASVGARIEFIEDVTSSSSHLINTYLAPFPDATEDYLCDFRSRFSAAEILDHLRRARGLKVLVVGEAILDDYYSCSTLARSTKAPIVATQFHSHDRFPGGALAVANHVAAFCDHVGLLAMLGEQDSEESWIRERLRDNISASFFHKRSAPTIVKCQYREPYFAIPLFEMNTFSDKPLSESEDAELCGLLEKTAADYDVIIVADYGHTMLTTQAVALLDNLKNFLAVSTQVNAANLGHHAIGRYGRADYLALNELELRLESHDRGGRIEDMLDEVARRLKARTAAVTIGKQGCICRAKDGECCSAPALATRVVDRFGARDAFFALTALCAAVDVPIEILAYLGNVAGAEVVATVGNSQFLEEVPFQRHVQSLLK